MPQSTLKEQIIHINTKLDGFITLYASETQEIKDKQKENTEYLKGEVHKALNSHSEIKARLLDLERREYQCPILAVQEDVDMLKSETAESRAKYKFAEIRKGMNVWNVVKGIGIIVIALSAIISLVISLRAL